MLDVYGRGGDTRADRIDAPTPDNPTYAAMFVDDVGNGLAKRGGMIDKLPRKKIPCLAPVPDRCSYSDGCGVEFAMPADGPACITETGTPYADAQNVIEQV